MAGRAAKVTARVTAPSCLECGQVAALVRSQLIYPRRPDERNDRMPPSVPLRRYAKTNDIGNITKRFAALADVRVGDGCWRWLGKKNKKGYGYFAVGGQGAGTQLAHRFAYSLLRGRIPKGLWVLHRCDNPSCVNPTHLFLGTGKDNMQDAKTKGRLKPPPRICKLTDEAVSLIRASRAKPTELARLYGVSREQIRRIKNGASRCST